MEQAPILDAWYAALRSGDEAAFQAGVTEDIAILYRGRPGLLPWTGEWHGVAACRRLFSIVAQHLEIIAITPRLRMAQDDRVAVLLSGHWRARATGREVQADVMNLFMLRDGRVACYEVFHDTAALREALADTRLRDTP
jgi:ketosteroid isomerase-like protein